MAIDPKLVSIKKAGDLPSGIPTATGEFLYFEDETLKKAEMSDLYDRVESAYLGIITPSTTIPTGSWYGTVLEAGTFNNVTPAITVDAADFDVENGTPNNEVRIIISEGVATKDVRRVKGGVGDSAYEVAVANGFVGTEAEWLDSLKGENKIEQWTAKIYIAGQQVLHNNIWWEAVVNTTAAQEPGVVAETIWEPIMESIAPDSVFDYIDSTNLIIKDDLLPNQTYNTTSGSLQTVSGRLTTPKIPSLPNTAYTLTGGRPQYYGVFFWRADGSYISGSTSGSVGVVQPYTFTTPPDTAFMAVTPTDRDYALYIDTVQLNLGSEVLPYEPGYVNKPIIKPALIPSGGGGQAYDQSLNTFDSVSFANLEVEGLLLDLPTSPAGLTSGQAWVDTSNGNTLKIV